MSPGAAGAAALAAAAAAASGGTWGSAAAPTTAALARLAGRGGDCSSSARQQACREPPPWHWRGAATACSRSGSSAWSSSFARNNSWAPVRSFASQTARGELPKEGPAHDKLVAVPFALSRAQVRRSGSG